MKRDLRIVFMGTPEFAIPSLEILLNNNYDIKAVVTAPDKPAGRGRKLRQPPLKEYALKRGLKVLQPEKLKDPLFSSELQKLDPNLQVVVAFRMLPEQVWKKPVYGTFNLHASLLPQYRGAAPINHAIINGEGETGLTTFLLDEKIDTGKILYQKKTSIEEMETAGELHDRMKHLGAELVLKTVRAIEYEEEVPIEQEKLIPMTGPLKAAPKIHKEDCRINWDKPADEVYNLIRGLSPYPAAFSELILPDGSKKIMKILFAEKTAKKSKVPSGYIKTDSSGYIHVSCADQFLSLKKIQLEGKKAVKVEDFLRGNTVEDHKFGLPFQDYIA